MRWPGSLADPEIRGYGDISCSGDILETIGTASGDLKYLAGARPQRRAGYGVQIQANTDRYRNWPGWLALMPATMRGVLNSNRSLCRQRISFMGLNCRVSSRVDARLAIYETAAGSRSVADRLLSACTLASAVCECSAAQIGRQCLVDVFGRVQFQVVHERDEFIPAPAVADAFVGALFHADGG
jgi:hypothetical protein